MGAGLRGPRGGDSGRIHPHPLSHCLGRAGPSSGLGTPLPLISASPVSKAQTQGCLGAGSELKTAGLQPRANVRGARRGGRARPEPGSHGRLGGSAGRGAGVQMREAPVRVSRCQPGAPPARPLPARQAALRWRNSPAFLGPPGPPSRRLTSVSSSHLAGPGCQPGPQPCLGLQASHQWGGTSVGRPQTPWAPQDPPGLTALPSSPGTRITAFFEGARLCQGV